MIVIIENSAYNIPKEIITVWIRMTSEFNDRMMGMWFDYAKTNNIPKGYIYDIPDDELTSFMKEYLDFYCDLLMDVILDMKDTMKSDFESYRMTGELEAKVLQNHSDYLKCSNSNS